MGSEEVSEAGISGRLRSGFRGGFRSGNQRKIERWVQRSEAGGSERVSEGVRGRVSEVFLQRGVEKCFRKKFRKGF